MFIQTPNGQVYAYTGGKAFPNQAGDKPCVIFIHGAQHDHSVWILQTRYLAHHGYPVLALDLPGHGRSAATMLTSVESMAEFVLSLAEQLKLPNYVLVGHSMGSLIALEAASRAAQKKAYSTSNCVGAVLVATAFPMQVSEALLQACASNEANAFDLINRFSHSSLSHYPGNPGPGFSVFWQNRRLMERQTKGVLLNDFKACNEYQNGLKAAATLACKALMVLAQNDAMTPPRAAAALKERMTQSLAGDFEVQTLTDCGHAIMSENPDALLLALKGFLAKI